MNVLEDFFLVDGKVHLLESGSCTTRREKRETELERDEKRRQNLRRPEGMMVVEFTVFSCKLKPLEDYTKSDAEEEYVVRCEPFFDHLDEFFAVFQEVFVSLFRICETSCLF